MQWRNRAALLLVLLLAPACERTGSLSGPFPTANPPNPPNPPSPSASTMTLQVLVAELRRQATTVEQLDRMPPSSFPFFAVPAVPLDVNGRRVSVFEYLSASEAQADAARVSRDGHLVGNASILWVDITRFYRNDRVVVLYVGRDGSVIQALDSVLGKPFAGSGAGLTP